MRPNIGLIQALRAPFALNLKAIRAVLGQNQLRLASMADLEARPGAAPALAWPLARVRAASSMVLLLGLATAGGMAAALLASAAGEVAMLALLALLAVAGAFLILGLLSGFLRVSERVAEAEIVKTVADGLETGLKIVDGQGAALYRNRALERLTGRRAGRHATLEELFAGEPVPRKPFSASTAPPSVASRGRRSSTCARASPTPEQAAGSGSAYGPFLPLPARPAE